MSDEKSPSIQPAPSNKNLYVSPKRAQEIINDIANGDQSWRLTIRERYAAFLEVRATNHADMIAKCEKLATQCDDATLAARFRANNAKVDEVRRGCLQLAQNVRSGHAVFDEVEAESLCRDII